MEREPSGFPFLEINNSLTQLKCLQLVKSGKTTFDKLSGPPDWAARFCAATVRAALLWPRSGGTTAAALPPAEWVVSRSMLRHRLRQKRRESGRGPSAFRQRSS